MGLDILNTVRAGRSAGARRIPPSIVAALRLAASWLLATSCAHAAQIAVSTVADNVLVDGKVSLREALVSVAVKHDYNADVAAARQSDYGPADVIEFAIGVDAKTIGLAGPLPAVASGTKIDGTTQPGYAGLNLITIDGAQAGAATDGLVLLEGSTVNALDIVNFGRHGLRSDDDIVFAHGFDSAGVVDPLLADSFLTIAINQCNSTDNGGDGLRVDAGTAVSADSLRVLRNRGVGVRAGGGLVAATLVATFNAGDGVLVDSANAVELVEPNIQYSGQHPQLPPTDQAGLRVLRASKADVAEFGLPLVRGGVFVHGSGTIANHTGDGVDIGDTAEQTGVVQALIGDLQIHDNRTGIRIVQRDDSAHRTSSSVLSNNIYNNSASGLHVSSSFMYAGYSAAARVISANDVHHNAVTPAGQCSIATATQTAAQVVFDGPVSATAEEILACQPAGVDTAAECNALSDPTGPQSNGRNNHCMWTGASCVVAWDMGGTEGSVECDSSRNRIFAYVNDANDDPSTQKGVFATNGAYTRARRNTWGVGGANNGTFEDQSSQIDSNNDCGAIATCP